MSLSVFYGSVHLRCSFALIGRCTPPLYNAPLFGGMVHTFAVYNRKTFYKRTIGTQRTNGKVAPAAYGIVLLIAVPVR